MPNERLKLAELIGALSHALDLTEGQPQGHCVRCCWIGMHIGREIGLATEQLHDLYYTLLLKDLGCSSNAARICALLRTDDLTFKRNAKLVDGSLTQVASFVIRNTGLKAGLAERFATFFTSIMNGDKIAGELIQTRCTRGAEIARQLRFNGNVAAGIQNLDEHWNGKGQPQGLRGAAIPLFSRIALLAQVVDVFHCSGGTIAAIGEVQKRSGGWFDPELVTAFCSVMQRENFWQGLISEYIDQEVFALEPAQFSIEVDGDYLDEIAEGFAQVVDSKSPFTAGHSQRVAAYTGRIAAEMGYSGEERRWLKRAALLHDVGKLGVSNSILDKPGKLTPEEWAEVKHHPRFTEEILSRIGVFAELAQIAGAHHEKLDGTGYYKGLAGDEIKLGTRIMTTADIFDAITAARPYRDAIPVEKALEIMSKDLHTALDPNCFAALKSAIAKFPVEPNNPRVEVGMTIHP